jgi:hypothetical protein
MKILFKKAAVQRLNTLVRLIVFHDSEGTGDEIGA